MNDLVNLPGSFTMLVLQTLRVRLIRKFGGVASLFLKHPVVSPVQIDFSTKPRGSSPEINPLRGYLYPSFIKHLWLAKKETAFGRRAEQAIYVIPSCAVECKKGENYESAGEKRLGI
jgi:von Hippel-Lindau disease tumor suppressor protein